MLLTGENTRVLQMHLTTRCNLRCTHCYSSSSPEGVAQLPHSVAVEAIESASALRYNTVSFSGGEPLLTHRLAELAQHARSLGMGVNLVTNGMLVNQRRLDELAASVDGVAISLDGMPERHNRMRGAANAFDKMHSGLELLRASGIPFAFVFTLSAENLHELEWAADFACREGAKGLQIHPLEEAGRAGELHPGQEPREDIAAIGWLVALRLQQIYAGRLAISIDLADAHRPPVAADDALRLARECEEKRLPLGRFLSPLVLEPDGCIIPLAYGFARSHALGLLTQEKLADLASRWARQKATALAHLYAKELVRARESGWPLVNIYERMRTAAGAGLVALTA